MARREERGSFRRRAGAGVRRRFQLVPTFIEQGWLNEMALPALAQLDEQLDAMSGEHYAGLWDAAALAGRAGWARVRALARAALILLA
jgi:hypothetical protein